MNTKREPLPEDIALDHWASSLTVDYPALRYALMQWRETFTTLKPSPEPRDAEQEVPTPTR